MHPTECCASLDEVRRARGDNLYWLGQLKRGFRPHRDGVDITEEFEADTQRRLALADSILAAYAQGLRTKN